MGMALERMAFCVRKRCENELGLYFASLSARTLLYKGMLTTGQLEPFFPDLSDRRFATELALVHSRFSTNTFPSWPLAHPFRYHRPQRRDQHRERQPQLDAGARVHAGQRRHPRRPRAAVPGLLRRCLRLRVLRRGAGAAPPGRPEPAARRPHDDPRGLGEPRGDGPRPAGLLRLPLHLHGAVGRAGLRHLHRRHRHRSGAGPQRPAPVALLGHRRRPRRDGQRGRRARHRPRQRGPQGPAAAGAHVPRGHREPPDRRRRGDQGRPRRRSTRTTSGCMRTWCTSTTCRPASTSCTRTPR